jgi:hypothetical protein
MIGLNSLPYDPSDDYRLEAENPEPPKHDIGGVGYGK